MTRRGRRVLGGFVAALLAGFALLFPTGALLRQSAALKAASHQLNAIRAENLSLAAQVKALNTNSYIAYLAHKDYGLVAPGQEAYVILPTPRP